MKVLEKIKDGYAHRAAHIGEHYCHLGYGVFVFIEGHGVYAVLGGMCAGFGIVMLVLEYFDYV